MTPPRRWRDDPTAPSSMRDLLRTGIPSKRMPGDLRQRSAARVNRLILVPAAAGVLVWIKGAAIAGLCVVGTVAVVHQVTDAKGIGAPRPKVLAPTTSRANLPGPTTSGQLASTAPAPEGVARSVVSRAPVPSASDPSMAPAEPRRRRPPGAPVPALKGSMDRTSAPGAAALEPAVDEAPIEPRPSDSLAREAAMLEEARAMLGSNPNGALAALGRYAEAFPDGRLTMESGLLAVDALRRLGRLEEAKARGGALLDQARGSLYEPRIRTLLRE